MKTISTYESFFSRLKDKLMPKEDIKKIDMDELYHIVKECFIELKDNGFDIDIECSTSNMYPKHVKASKAHKAGIEATFGPERYVYYIDISLPIYVSDLAKKLESFKAIDIKDYVLLLKDMLKDKFGLDIHVDIEDLPDDYKMENYQIKFDIPIT